MTTRIVKVFQSFLKCFLIPFLLLSQLLVAAPGCGGVIEAAEEEDDGRQPTAGSKGNMVSLGLQVFSQFVNVGTTLSFFDVNIYDLLGIGGTTYAELSDATIQRVAAAVGQTVKSEFLARDNANARALFNLIAGYSRTPCVSSSQTPNACSSTYLYDRKAAVQDLIRDGEYIFAQLSKADNGDLRLQAGQTIQNLGAMLVSHKVEKSRIEKLLNLTTDSNTSRASARDSARALVGHMNTLEVLFENWFDNQYKVEIVNPDINDRYRYRGCIQGPGMVANFNKWGVLYECGEFSKYVGLFGVVSGSPDGLLREEARNLREKAQDTLRAKKKAELLGAEFDALRNTMSFFGGLREIVPSSVRLRWSSAGPISGKTCVRINEDSDPHTWGDNYLCGEEDYGLRWSSAGPIPNMHCVQMEELSDPHTWGDNYLCSTQYLGLRWSQAGRYRAVQNSECVQINEAADPHAWGDNYLCLGSAATHVGAWSLQSGGAKDIGVGADGSVWIIGSSPEYGGYGIYQWKGYWSKVPGAAVRIAVGPNGQPWVVNSFGQIFQRQSNGSWTQYPGGATDIGVGADGSVWIIGTTPEGGGYGIYVWFFGVWNKVAGGAVRISVGPDGFPWLVNSGGNIYHLNASNFTWTQLPGLARDISAGADGSVWIIGQGGTDSPIFRWAGGRWLQSTAQGAAQQIAVSPSGQPWVTTSLNNIFQMIPQ